MLCVDREDVLDEECVELGEQPEKDEKTEQTGATERICFGFAVVPIVSAPAGRRELQRESLHFSATRFDVSNTFPVELSHLQEVTQFHAHINSNSIAQKNVQNQRIPPAFGEIRQQIDEH